MNHRAIDETFLTQLVTDKSHREAFNLLKVISCLRSLSLSKSNASTQSRGTKTIALAAVYRSIDAVAVDYYSGTMGSANMNEFRKLTVLAVISAGHRKYR